VPLKTRTNISKKQVGRLTSAERGTNTTAIHCSYVPPAFLLARKTKLSSWWWNHHLGGSKGCTVPSGWMDIDTFQGIF